MPVNFKHAYNYWRMMFVEQSDGEFSKKQFDEWFCAGAKPDADALGFTHIVDANFRGTKEHFSQTLTAALVDTLNACAEGRFKP